MTQPPPNPRYSALPAMLRRMDAVNRKLGHKAKTKAEHAWWRRELVTKLKNITGYDTMEPAPLKPRILGVKEFRDHTRQHVEIQTERGVWMTFYVLIPKKRKGSLPAMICSHGHSSGGKLSPAGDARDPEVAGKIKVYNYAYGLALVRQGFLVFCPDARGFGERIEPTIYQAYGKSILNNSCQYLNQMGYPLGQTVTGMWTFDLHRLIDYIETRPDADATRLGIAGLSGGGLQSLWATALDQRGRIKATVVSGYFYGYRESLLIQHFNCACNYVPHLFEYADMGDLGALVAPRPLLIETGDTDGLNGVNLKSGMKNVRSQVAITRKAYKLFNAGENLVHDVFAGGHKWHGAVAVPWLTKQLGASAV